MSDETPKLQESRFSKVAWSTISKAALKSNLVCLYSTALVIDRHFTLSARYEMALLSNGISRSTNGRLPRTGRLGLSHSDQLAGEPQTPVHGVPCQTRRELPPITVAETWLGRLSYPDRSCQGLCLATCPLYGSIPLRFRSVLRVSRRVVNYV